MKVTQLRHRILVLMITILCPLLLIYGLHQVMGRSEAWDEELLYFYEPWHGADETVYSDTTVSSVHFDLVGALALAAGFSVTDAATIQLYSQLNDSGLITGSEIYQTSAVTVTWPEPPPITEVMTSTICPSPSTTADIVTMGSANPDMIECPGCFTGRLGAYGVFFHFPHDNEIELGAIERWAYGETEILTAWTTYGYSTTGTVEESIANPYEHIPCFYQQFETVDTGDVAAGSLEAFGLYLHSLGDYWSHKDCIEAADAQELPFATHVDVGELHPLAPCRWLMHQTEFGTGPMSDADRTLSGTLALYEALVDYATGSDRPVYRPIPLTAEDGYLEEMLATFVYTTTSLNPQPRRDVTIQMRQWALETRAANPDYWLYQGFLPVAQMGED